MTTLEDLKSILKDTLEQKGVLSDIKVNMNFNIKAKIRAEIFTALDQDSVGKPKLSNENLIINELIKEYLEYNKYHHSVSVLCAESGQPTSSSYNR